VRFTSALNLVLIPTILLAVHRICSPDTTDRWILNAIAAALGALLGRYPLDRQTFPELNLHRWLHQVIAWSGIRLSMLLTFVAAVSLMPESFGWKLLAVAFCYLAFHFAFQFGLFLKYLRWVKYLTPTDERLQHIVNETSTRMAVPVHSTGKFGGVVANAFAFPTTRDLIFSNRLLEICTDQETSAICAHELAHLSESKSVLAGRLIGSLILFPLIFITPTIHYLGGFGIVPPYAGLIALALFSRSVSRKMEKRADQIALIDQPNEGVYARALEKLYRNNQSPAVSVSKRPVHPHLYDRLIAAGVTPDFPRPKAPKRLTWIGWVYVFAVIILLPMMFMRIDSSEQVQSGSARIWKTGMHLQSKGDYRFNNSATSTTTSGKACGAAWSPARKMVFEL
jgi:Zn-dependent protease with chaperone function